MTTGKLPISCVKNWRICFSLCIMSLTFLGSQKHFFCIHLPIIFQALLRHCNRFPSSLFFPLPPAIGAYSDTRLGHLLYTLKHFNTICWWTLQTSTLKWTQNMWDSVENNQQDATLWQNLLFHRPLKAQHVSSGILLIIRSSNCVCSLWFTYSNKIKDFVYIIHSLY